MQSKKKKVTVPEELQQAPNAIRYTTFIRSLTLPWKEQSLVEDRYLASNNTLTKSPLVFCWASNQKAPAAKSITLLYTHNKCTHLHHHWEDQKKKPTWRSHQIPTAYQLKKKSSSLCHRETGCDPFAGAHHSKTQEQNREENAVPTPQPTQERWKRRKKNEVFVVCRES